MSASQPGNMRGPWVTTPLLLLLLLLTALTGTVSCKDEETETVEDDAGDSGDADTAEALQFTFNSTFASDAATTEGPADENVEEDHGSSQHNDHGNFDTTESPGVMGATTEPVIEDDGLDLIIIVIPVALVVTIVIIVIVCGIFINRRWNTKSKNEDLRKEDPHLDESSTEKVPMPMFEEDVPSVLEVEMEELDQWMKKDG